VLHRIQAYSQWLEKQISHLRIAKDYTKLAEFEAKLVKLKVLLVIWDEDLSVMLLELLAQQEQAAAERSVAVRGPAKGITIPQRRFLDAYARTGDVLRAARLSKVARTTHYNWLKSRPAYAEAFDQIRFGVAQPIRMVAGAESPARKTPASAPTPEDKDAKLLDEIALGLTKQKFKTLDAARQKTVRELAAKIA
jgi:hypothetical protein